MVAELGRQIVLQSPRPSLGSHTKLPTGKKYGTDKHRKLSFLLLKDLSFICILYTNCQSGFNLVNILNLPRTICSKLIVSSVNVSLKFDQYNVDLIHR